MALSGRDLEAFNESIKEAYGQLSKEMRGHVRGVELSGKAAAVGGSAVLNDIDFTVMGDTPDEAELKTLRGKAILTPSEAERLQHLEAGQRAKSQFVKLADEAYRRRTGRSFASSRIQGYASYGGPSIPPGREPSYPAGSPALDHLHTLEKKKIITFTQGPGSQVQTTVVDGAEVVGKWNGLKSVGGIADEALTNFQKDHKPKWITRVADAADKTGIPLTPQEHDLVGRARQAQVTVESVKGPGPAAIDRAEAESFLRKYSTPAVVKQVDAALAEVESGIKSGAIASADDAEAAFVRAAERQGIASGPARSAWREIASRAGGGDALREAVRRGSVRLNTGSGVVLPGLAMLGVGALTSVVADLVEGGKTPEQIATNAAVATGVGAGVSVALEFLTWAAPTAMGYVLPRLPFVAAAMVGYQIGTKVNELDAARTQQVLGGTQNVLTEADQIRRLRDEIRRIKKRLLDLYNRTNTERGLVVSEHLPPDQGLEELRRLEEIKMELDRHERSATQDFKRNVASTAQFGNFGSILHDAFEVVRRLLEQTRMELEDPEFKTATQWLPRAYAYEATLTPERKLEQAETRLRDAKRKWHETQAEEAHREYLDAQKTVNELTRAVATGKATGAKTTASPAGTPSLNAEEGLRQAEERLRTAKSSWHETGTEETHQEYLDAQKAVNDLTRKLARGEARMTDPGTAVASAGAFAFKNEDGDTVTSEPDGEGGTKTTCTNGETATFTKEGAKHSVQQTPIGPVTVDIAEDGTKWIKIPGGTETIIRPDDTIERARPDGTHSVQTGEGIVKIERPGRPTQYGLTLKAAQDLGLIDDVQVTSTGANQGTVAKLRGSIDKQKLAAKRSALEELLRSRGLLKPGKPFQCEVIRVPPSKLKPAKPGDQGRMTDGGDYPVDDDGKFGGDMGGGCIDDPEKPPPPSGDTGDTPSELSPEDPQAHVSDLVDQGIKSGAIRENTWGNRDNTKNHVEAYTRWRLKGIPQARLRARFLAGAPADLRDKEERVDETAAKSEAFSKAGKNLGKQLTETVPPLPPPGTMAGGPGVAAASVAAQAVPVSFRPQEAPSTPAGKTMPDPTITTDFGTILDLKKTHALPDAGLKDLPTLPPREDYEGTTHSYEEMFADEIAERDGRIAKEKERLQKSVEGSMQKVKESLADDEFKKANDRLAKAAEAKEWFGLAPSPQDAKARRRFLKDDVGTGDYRQAFDQNVATAFKGHKFCTEKSVLDKLQRLKDGLKGLTDQAIRDMFKGDKGGTKRGFDRQMEHARGLADEGTRKATMDHLDGMAKMLGDAGVPGFAR